MVRTKTVCATLLALIPAGVVAQEVSVGVRLATTYEVSSDIVYHTAGGYDLTLDLYVPAQPEGPVPVLVYYHGGGWVIGDRISASLLTLPYLEKGFAVANVTYRLGEQALAPAAVVDALCALRWVVRNAEERGLDPDRVVTSGHSAGGHLALIVAMLPPDSDFANECTSIPELFDNTLDTVRPAAVVNWFGITDVNDLLVEPHRALYAEQWIGGQLNGAEIARAVSPLTYVRAGLPPILTIHGDADTVVPYEHAVRLKEALEAVGGANQLVTVPGGGHGGFSLDQDASHYDRIWAFLEQHGIRK